MCNKLKLTNKLMSRQPVNSMLKKLKIRNNSKMNDMFNRITRLEEKWKMLEKKMYTSESHNEKLMSNFEPHMGLIFNDDGTATLSSKRYNKLVIIFEQSVAKHLKDIDPREYCFSTDGENEWQITSHAPPNGGIASYVGFLGGTIEKDGKKIICTDPVGWPLIRSFPLERQNYRSG